ncbi:N-acetylmuramoyl-L-alanine amidase [Marivirga tractuosa]|uniref:N-acetylmuramoyl-L-alanine amidase n=1 Tax=Marivirga tractuosa TaxID=1006 RepID=UPI0035CEA9F3
MNALLIYFLKVVGVQAILYLIYNLIFHKSGRYAINRFYLILALVVSFLIPFISLPNLNYETATEIIETEKTVWNELSEITTIQTELIPVETANQSNYITEFIILAISLLSLFLLARLIFSHFKLVNLKRQSEQVVKNGFNIYCCNIESPFSYFSSVFIPKSIIESSSFDIILKHELVHVHKGHSIDRIFLEIILAICWFNPFHYLFRNRLIETHEFQADEEVILLQNDPIHYQKVLYQQLNSKYNLVTANHFKLNTIKTRIKMMNKKTKLSKWHYLLILPALALMTFSFANKENVEFVEPVKSDVSEVFENVLNSSDNFTPSIFPLKNVKDVKLTKGFGNRMHPILKEERMHEGIDLATYKGNSVLATADGIVVESGSIIEGAYGKIIRIEHNGIYETAYAHLSEINVEKGDQVKKGDIIGTAGTSGQSVEPHLHYGVKEIGKNYLNPVDFIKDYDFKTNSDLGLSTIIKLGKPNQKLKVVLDPGHGGKDKGISSSNYAEKEIALLVANEVAKNFQNSDKVEIILTRDKDEMVSLEDRINYSENSDLFVSLNAEAHEDTEENMMLAFYNDNNENTEASKYFSEQLSHEFSGINKKFRVGYTRGYYILKNAKSPAVMFCMGYFSNPESVEYLNSEKGMKEIAKELSDAIVAAL